MVNNNNKYIPKAPETFQVAYLETNQEVKKSPLSPAARSKVIRKWGGGYVSENQESYGPCSTCGVSNKTFKINMDLRNAIGSHRYGSASNTDEAMNEAAAILRGDRSWKGDDGDGCFRRANREDPVAGINKAIEEHIEGEGKAVIRTVHNTPN